MSSEHGPGGGRVAAVRGAALFLGIFALVNVVGSAWWRGFDATVWWVDLRVLPVWAGRGVVAAGGVGLVMVAVNGVRTRWMVRGVRVAVGALLAAAIFNMAEFYAVWGRGEIAPGMVVPLSAGVAAVLGAVLWAAGRPRAALRGRERAVFGAAVAGAMVAFPLAQMFCFGTTDYRRQADAIVVFGALVYRDGTPSQALADRVNTAIALYKDGRAPVLIFSGGPGAGAISEAQAMRTLALSKGVPAAAIVLDEAGLHTDATVRNTAALFAARGYQRVLAVSHFYHLPRIKMRYERELAGARVEVVTVPAAESQPLVSMPRFVAREVVALWAYYLGLERGRG
jgi:vancomycin permeability regulator SanA